MPGPRLITKKSPIQNSEVGPSLRAVHRRLYSLRTGYVDSVRSHAFGLVRHHLQARAEILFM